MLILEDEGKLADFIKNDAQAAHEQQVEWVVDGGVLYFRSLTEDKLTITAVRVIEENLHLATELERIV